MNGRKLKTAIIVAVSIVGIMVSLAVRHRAKTELAESDIIQKQQQEQLLQLTAEHERLSNLLTHATNNFSADDHAAELAKLRSEAEALRKQTNDLAKRLAEEHAARRVAKVPTVNPRRYDHTRDVISDSDSEEYKQHLYKIGRSSPHSGAFNIDAFKDAQNLAEAVRKYAHDHQGEIPANFDQAAPHLFKEYRAPHSSEFEIVYHGSLSELTNIPLQAVALVRERQPWPTPAGKWARIYATAHGSIQIVESDDNFQVWEAEHIIPPTRGD